MSNFDKKVDDTVEKYEKGVSKNVDKLPTLPKKLATV